MEQEFLIPTSCLFMIFFNIIFKCTRRSARWSPIFWISAITLCVLVVRKQYIFPKSPTLIISELKVTLNWCDVLCFQVSRFPQFGPDIPLFCPASTGKIVTAPWVMLLTLQRAKCYCSTVLTFVGLLSFILYLT